jgi:hypothetical protein
LCGTISIRRVLEGVAEHGTHERQDLVDGFRELVDEHDQGVD